VVGVGKTYATIWMDEKFKKYSDSTRDMFSVACIFEFFFPPHNDE
jgi:hypothetical protein